MTSNGSKLNRAIILERYVRTIAAVIIVGLVAYGFFLIRAEGQKIINLQNSLHGYVNSQSTDLKQNQKRFHHLTTKSQDRLDKIITHEFKKLFVGLRTGQTPNFAIVEKPILIPAKKPQGHKPKPAPRHHHPKHHPKPKPTPTCTTLQQMFSPGCLVPTP